jgi:hypothetical protein
MIAPVVDAASSRTRLMLGFGLAKDIPSPNCLAPLANFAISAAIAHALLAELLLVNARLPQFPTFAPVDRPPMVTWFYSNTSRPDLNFL